MQRGFAGLVGISPPMRRVYRLIHRISQHSYPVLILGESGTGKELVARSIHYCGPRRQSPFVPVDCSSLVPTLIESELFGYVKGAFTGATHPRQGLLEAADKGTLFLDEIGDLPADMQAKLLRVVQEKKVKPVGSTDWTDVDMRVIAATNRDLEAAVKSGTFRLDLYYRLNVVKIKLSPLRERKSDIPLLVHYFFGKLRDPANPPYEISDEALRHLLVYNWPGNVRELENIIERGMALASGPTIEVTDLPPELQHLCEEPGRPEADTPQTLAETVRSAIFRALHKTGGDKMAAARLLGIGKTTLYRRLRRYKAEKSSTSRDCGCSSLDSAEAPSEGKLNRPPDQ